MLNLFRLIVSALFLIPITLLFLVFFCLEQQPLVINSAPLSHSDISRAKKIISNNDPRTLQDGQKKSVTLSAADISVALNFLRAQVIKGGIKTSFIGDTIHIASTAVLPNNPIGKFLNLQLTLIPEQQITVEQLSIGPLSIPPLLIQTAFSLYTQIEQGQQVTAIANMLQSAQIRQNKLQLSYLWDANAVQQAKNLVMTQQDKNTLVAYQQQLASITQKFSSNRQHSLTVLIEPLFRFAIKRSADHDPVLENRALLTVLAAYANGHSLKRLTGTEGAKSKHLKLTLQHRHDFVQHYTISAGLAATGGHMLADAVGLYKEYEDRKGSSGFSFTDLAADRAGVRLGKLATTSQASARRVQLLLAKNLNESVYMPKATDLPEGISARVFQTKYQNGSGSAYQRIVSLIEQRIDKLAIND